MNDHKMTIRISKELHKAAKLKGVEADITLSDVVRAFLRGWVDNLIEVPAEPEEEQTAKRE